MMIEVRASRGCPLKLLKMGSDVIQVPNFNVVYSKYILNILRESIDRNKAGKTCVHLT